MRFSSLVQSGSGIGNTLGFPTLNLDPSSCPEMEEGVYTVFARLGAHGIRLPAVMHFGARPTLNKSPSCEVHVLDMRIDIPPHSVEVEVIERIRDVQHFGSKQELIHQLHQDISTAKNLLCAAC